MDGRNHTTAHRVWLAVLLLILRAAFGVAADPVTSPASTIRVAAAQAAKRVIDFRLKPNEVLAGVEKNVAALEGIIDRAGAAKSDVLVLPEDTPGLLNWVGANESSTKEVLPNAVSRMIERLGAAAARHKMYLVVCSDFIESDGATYN